MRASWPEPVERVAGFLREAGAEARIEEFASGTHSAQDAARTVGCQLEQVVKSLVLVSDDERVIVALVPGDRRGDLKKIAAAAAARKVRVAKPGEVEAGTGFAPGAVAPFPLPDGARVLLDRTLLVHKHVWIGAGSASHLAEIGPAELLRLARADPVDAVLEPAYDPATPEGKGDPSHA